MKKLIGRITIEQWRNNQQIAFYNFPNDVTNVGKNTLVDAGFNGGAPGVNWSIGLMDANNFSALNSSDTMNGHPGWFEWLGVSASVRASWIAGAAALNQIQNASPLIISMTTAGYLQGLFVANDEVLGGATGLLWATCLFVPSIRVANYDFLLLTYNVEILN